MSHSNAPQARDLAHHLHPQGNPTWHEAVGPLVMVREAGVLGHGFTHRGHPVAAAVAAAA